MENVLPKYSKPLKSISKPSVNVDYWDQSLDLFDQKKFKETAIAVINYINPTVLENVDTNNDIKIIKTQGSAEIHVKITATTFSVKAPFLKITNQTNKVALLRRVAEANFSPLTLAQINLDNNDLFFEYEMPISTCQPNKVYDVLRQVCVYADDYDDLFIENYKATFYNQPKHTPLTTTEKEEVWNQIDTILKEYKEYSQFFKDKRWDDYEWDITVISLLKIANMPYVHGKLRTDLQEYINNLFNGNLNFNFRKDKGTNFMKELCSKDKSEIMSNIYHAEQFISLNWRSSEQIIKDWANGRLEMVQKYEKDKNNFNLSYYLQFQFLKLMYDYNLEKNYNDLLNTVLENVSGLEPDKAVSKLTKVFYKLQKGEVNNTKGSKKSFLSGLFN